MENFVRLTEDHRRERGRMIDAGDEAAALHFQKPYTPRSNGYQQQGGRYGQSQSYSRGQQSSYGDSRSGGSSGYGDRRDNRSGGGGGYSSGGGGSGYNSRGAGDRYNAPPPAPAPARGGYGGYSREPPPSYGSSAGQKRGYEPPSGRDAGRNSGRDAGRDTRARTSYNS